MAVGGAARVCRVLEGVRFFEVPGGVAMDALGWEEGDCVWSGAEMGS